MFYVQRFSRSIKPKGTRSFCNLVPPKQFFSQNPLSRANNYRESSEFLHECENNPNSKTILFHNLRPLVLQSKDGIKPFTTPLHKAKELASILQHDVPHKRLLTQILLGTKEQPYYAVDLSHCNEHKLVELCTEEVNKTNKDVSLSLTNLRATASQFPIADLAIVGQGRSLINWHKTHSYCANCGNHSVPSYGGFQRDCPSCKTSHYPRTDPVVIMLVHLNNEKCLLARQPSWDKGRYSVLAGFLEPGETIEEGVERETFEETGIQLEKVDYFASQPWPFPSSLMIGCIAKAKTSSIEINKELEHAAWFDRKDIKDVINGVSKQITLPPRYAISNQLIYHWTLKM